jgi:hypothetical protein
MRGDVMDQSDKFWGLRLEVPYSDYTLTHFWREKPTKEQLMKLDHKFTSRQADKLLAGGTVTASGWYYTLEELEFEA